MWCWGWKHTQRAGSLPLSYTPSPAMALLDSSVSCDWSIVGIRRMNLDLKCSPECQGKFFFFFYFSKLQFLYLQNGDDNRALS